MHGSTTLKALALTCIALSEVAVGQSTPPRVNYDINTKVDYPFNAADYYVKPMGGQKHLPWMSMARHEVDIIAKTDPELMDLKRRHQKAQFMPSFRTAAMRYHHQVAYKACLKTIHTLPTGVPANETIWAIYLKDSARSMMEFTNLRLGGNIYYNVTEQLEFTKKEAPFLALRDRIEMVGRMYIDESELLTKVPTKETVLALQSKVKKFDQQAFRAKLDARPIADIQTLRKEFEDHFGNEFALDYLRRAYPNQWIAYTEGSEVGPEVVEAEEALKLCVPKDDEQSWPYGQTPVLQYPDWIEGTSTAWTSE